MKSQDNHLDELRTTKYLWFFVTMLLVFTIAARTPIDSDFWWHLKAGEYLFQNGKPLLIDIFSFTRAGEPWVNHSWLGEGIIFGFYALAGIPGISSLVSIIATLSMMLIWRGSGSEPIINSTAIILGSIVASMVWSPRPQVFSLLLLSGLNYVLVYYRFRWRSAILILLPFFILWSNIHGGYPLGLILIGAFIFGDILNGFKQQKAFVDIIRSALPLIVIGILCFLVVAINPNTIHMWKIPFETVSIRSNMYISEWASPDFHDLTQQSILWLLFATFLVMILSKKSLDAVDLTILVAFGSMSLLSRRHCGPMAVVVTPILIRYGSLAFISLKKRSGDAIRKIKQSFSNSSDPAKIHRYRKPINLTIVGVLTIIACTKVYVVTHPVVFNHLQEKVYPAQAISQLNYLPSGGNLLNEYNWGGMIIWNAPKHLVFIDGRTDLYGDEIIDQWRQLIQAEGKWEQLMDRWDIEIVLLEETRPVVDRLIAAGWKIQYKENGRVLLIDGASQP